MYRMRSICSLLDRHELENSEIYFSSLEDLNDPMEGFIDLFWKGDEILWTNLFKHYILCLEQVIFLSCLKKDILTKEDVSVDGAFHDLSAGGCKVLIHSVWDKFFSNETVKKCIKYISNTTRLIHKPELLMYLNMFHYFALKCILEEYDNKKLGNYEWIKNQVMVLDDFEQYFNQAISIDDDPLFNTALEAIIHVYKQSILSLQYNYYNITEVENDKTKTLILIEFPAIYMEKINQLIYPQTYISCFMEDCRNASLWAQYTDNHQGVCLKFKQNLNDNGDEMLMLYSTILYYGNGDRRKDYTPHLLKKVRYRNTRPQMDFFKSLCNIPLKILCEYWYSDEDGKASKCISPFDYQEWHESQWKKYSDILSIKSLDWEKENEYRIILPDLISSYSDVNERKLKYRFEDLEGIIFGYKTDIKVKLQIIKIIEEKCKSAGRTDFDFFQADFGESGDMIIEKLGNIKMGSN